MQEVITSPAAAKKTSVDAAVAAAFSPKKEQRTTPTALHGSKDVGKCLVKHCGTSSDWSALNGIEDTPSHSLPFVEQSLYIQYLWCLYQMDM